jgi:hypothetical protein
VTPASKVSLDRIRVNFEKAPVGKRGLVSWLTRAAEAGVDSIFRHTLKKNGSAEQAGEIRSGPCSNAEVG